MNTRITSLFLVLAMAGAVHPAPARAVDLTHGLISIENPTEYALKVTITGGAGVIETVDVPAYKRVYANRCCYKAHENYGVSAVFAKSGGSAIGPTRVFLWSCSRNGSTFGYARVYFWDGTGHPLLNPIHDGSCYNDS